jgi:3-oxoacyl-[acyl-carrier protein] reductase
MAALDGQIALVTGGSRGLGRAIAIAFAEAGADVAVNYQYAAEQAAEVEQAVRALGRRAVCVQADVSTAPEVSRMVDVVERSLGAPLILVNNAGIARVQPVEEVSEHDWDEILRVNLKSVFLVTQRVLPAMRAAKFGRIINLSSVAAQLGGVVGPHYAASKAGMIGITHSYASLLAKEGITANAIAPALIDTDMVKANLRARRDVIPVAGSANRPKWRVWR